MKVPSIFAALLPALLLLSGGAIPIHADLINENFGDGLLPPTMETAGSSVIITGGGVTFGNPPSRSYLRTIAADFFGQDFIAEVTVTVMDYSIAYFGMGEGSPNGGFFDEPALPSINLRLHASEAAGGRVDAADNFANLAFPPTAFGSPGSGTHRLRLNWNAAAKTALFEVDANYASGPFVADLTSSPVDGSDNLQY